MPSDYMTQWFNSKKSVQLDNLQLTLRESPFIRNTPLSVQRGQAETFFPKAEDKTSYILKRFHDSSRPDLGYIEAISFLLPACKPFRCGTQRKVLKKTSLKQVSGCFFSPGLAAYLENAVLMPKTDGQDWNSLIDGLRNQKESLTPNKRLALCNNLAQIVRMMEKHQVSHRDLSGGNIFIDKTSLEISLIDFDSLYHPRLVMPGATTTGSEGYIAPFIRQENTRQTFCPISDRFALTVLCVEFLILDAASPFSHEGGIFQQDDLYNRTGKTISYVEKKLQREFPEALKLFQKAIRSNSFANCPRPEDWITVSLAKGEFPRVISLPTAKLEIPKSNQTTPALVLPEDPWKNSKGEINDGNLKQSANQCHSPALRGRGRFDLNDFIKTQLWSLEHSNNQAPGQLFRPADNRVPELFQNMLSKSFGQDLSGKDFSYLAGSVPLGNTSLAFQCPVIKTKTV